MVTISASQFQKQCLLEKLLPQIIVWSLKTLSLAANDSMKDYLQLAWVFQTSSHGAHPIHYLPPKEHNNKI